MLDVSDSDARLTHLFVWLTSYKIKICELLFYCDSSTQVARVLLAVEKGRLHEFAGKNLDNIDVSGTFYTTFFGVSALFTIACVCRFIINSADSWAYRTSHYVCTSVCALLIDTPSMFLQRIGMRYWDAAPVASQGRVISGVKREQDSGVIRD